MLINSLRLNWCILDLSSVQFDGSHTLAKNDGAAIGYQGRKAGRTTNALFLADNQGLGRGHGHAPGQQLARHV